MDEPTIDRSAFQDLKDTAGADFAAELLDTFIAEAPQMLAEMRAALAAGSAEHLRRAAHSLKSNAHTFGAMALGARARALELGGLPADASDIDALAALLDKATTALKELSDG